jgi:hypothetical protein
MEAHDYHLDIFFDNLKLKVYYPIKNIDIGYFYGPVESTLCTRSNMTHHAKMSQARVSVKL